MAAKSANPYHMQGDNPFEEPGPVRAAAVAPPPMAPAPYSPAPAAAPGAAQPQMQFFNPTQEQLFNQPAFVPQPAYTGAIPPQQTNPQQTNPQYHQQQQQSHFTSPAAVAAVPPADAPPPARDLANSKFWTLEFYQQFFDVDTKDVLGRMANTLLPLAPPDFLAARRWHANADVPGATAGAAPSNGTLEAGGGAFSYGSSVGGGATNDGSNDALLVEKRPDLYGPFWVSTTLWMALAIVGNMLSRISYSHAQRTAQANPTPPPLPGVTTAPVAEWSYDFTTASIACVVIYSYCAAMSFLVWAAMKWKEVPVTLLDIVCLYGYSMFLFFLAAILCVIPITWLQWIIVVVAGLWSLAYLLANLWHVWKLTLDRIWFLGAVIVVSIAHMLLTMSFKFYFFHYTL